MGDDQLPLPDINTSLSSVRAALATYISTFVRDYAIDGLRIDAAKHVEQDFWTGFCGEGGAAGVFCIGEVYQPEIPCVSIVLRSSSVQVCGTKRGTNLFIADWQRNGKARSTHCLTIPHTSQ